MLFFTTVPDFGVGFTELTAGGLFDELLLSSGFAPVAPAFVCVVSFVAAGVASGFGCEASRVFSLFFARPANSPVGYLRRYSRKSSGSVLLRIDSQKTRSLAAASFV